MNRILTLMLAITATWIDAGAATFTPLGFLPGGFSSGASAISADGRVVVGDATSSAGGQAFRWTAEEGMVGLGDLPGGTFSSAAFGVSADGSVIVGQGSSSGFDANQAFRWTQATGMVGLGDLPGGRFLSRASDVSGDGSVVVGDASSVQTCCTDQGFRWTEASGMVALGDLPGGPFQSHVGGISDDAQVIVGQGRDESVHGDPIRWLGAVPYVLDVQAGAPSSGGANGVSADGRFIVGLGVWDQGPEAFLWSESDGTTRLGDLPGGEFYSEAADVSDDGSVVVGYGSTGALAEAMIWTRAGGMQRLVDVLVAGGATGLDGWSLKYAVGVSADGTRIAGVGINADGGYEAFVAQVATVPLPGAAWLLGPVLLAMPAFRRRATRGAASVGQK